MANKNIKEYFACDDMGEYMEKQYDAEGEPLLYVHQGFMSNVLFTKEEVMKLESFIDKNF